MSDDLNDLDPACSALLEAAWSGCISWAWQSPMVRADFTKATGVAISETRTPIEAAIDRATGREAAVAAKFVEWVTVEIFGIDCAPEAVRNAIKAGTFEADAVNAVMVLSRAGGGEP